MNTAGSRREPIVSGAIMSHPARSRAAEDLSQLLAGTPVVYDPYPGGSNSLMTAMHAWASFRPESTHHFVVQDDVITTSAFLAEVQHAATIFPDSAVAFYSNWDSFTGAASRLALLAGAGWVEAVRWEYFPTLATLLPKPLIGEFLDFARNASRVHFEDDEVLFDFLRMKDARSYVSVPAIVEHGGLPSLAGNPTRRAAAYTGGTFPTPSARDRVAHSITMCPFYWRGTPYTLIRSGAMEDHAWRYVHWTASAHKLGFDPQELRRRFDQQSGPSLRKSLPEAEQEFIYGLWISSFLLGVLPNSKHLEILDLTSGDRHAQPLQPAEEVVTRALQTLVPAALMKSAFPADHFEGRQEMTQAVALDGYLTGGRMAASL